MNLTKLFDMQRVLDQRIMDKHPELKGQDNLDWKVLALQVELGECANEHRGFKKWSNDQEPRTFKRLNCPDCMKKGYYRGNPPKDEEKGDHGLGNHWYFCDTCAGYLVVDKNPLLEEYVDCLHFVLTIGIELGFTDIEIWSIQEEGNTSQFLKCFEAINSLYLVYRVDGQVTKEIYENLFGTFVELGEMLGFTWEQIEQAYFEKNKINHTRQEQGY
ncbi:dUTP diphosphatase [Priestia sp. JV24]|uniref:dUTP diphosphatase n=1 Tax=Priestia TaxID=2800373 RepID=UPI0021D676CC|nr:MULTISPECIES: dUTP diphosphatase [Priestia]MCU7712453.1 dUTP diphosphatase [Priestia megaterium]MCW1046282.1 dUTP diphosphatase [Priestia sp. JV24]